MLRAGKERWYLTHCIKSYWLEFIAISLEVFPQAICGWIHVTLIIPTQIHVSLLIIQHFFPHLLFLIPSLAYIFMYHLSYFPLTFIVFLPSWNGLTVCTYVYVHVYSQMSEYDFRSCLRGCDKSYFWFFCFQNQNSIISCCPCSR